MYIDIYYILYMCIMDYWDYFMNNIYNNNNIYIYVYIYTQVMDIYIQ